MSTAAEFLADAAAKSVTLDGYNRYVLPHPETGKDQPWTRVTTFAGAIKDTWGLNRWALRMLAHGLAMRPDLVATVAVDISEFGAGVFDRKSIDGDCKELDKAIESAEEHAGSSVASTFGKVMHRFTEMVDGGEEPEVVPPLLDDDLAVYQTKMAAAGLTSVAIERIVCLPDLGVAGTLDRVLHMGRDAFIGDLKTGKDLGYSWGEIAVQLALYAHATHIWSGTAWEPMHPVDQDRAIVMWLPVGQRECTLWWVDIAAGWEAALALCGPVRKWRTRKDLAVRFDTSAPPESTPSQEAAATANPGGSVVTTPNGDGAVTGDRTVWVTARLKALAASERARNLVGQHWPDGVTVKPPWPMQAIDASAAALDVVEREIGADFGPTDPATTAALAPAEPEEPPERVPPWDVTDDGVAAAEEDALGLAAVIRRLSETEQALLRRWGRDATTEKRSFTEVPMTQRMWHCARAAISCARHLGDDDTTKAALTNVLGCVWGKDWLVGAVIGSLSATQAEALADAADAYGAEPF